MAEGEDSVGQDDEEGQPDWIPTFRAAPWIAGYRIDELFGIIGGYESYLSSSAEAWLQGKRLDAVSIALDAVLELTGRLGIEIAHNPLIGLHGVLEDLRTGKPLATWLKPTGLAAAGASERERYI